MLPLPDTTVATRKRIARKYKLAQLPDPRRFLHIRCGDDILEKLDQAGLPGDKIRWTDVLSEGPLPSMPTRPTGSGNEPPICRAGSSCL